MVAGAFGSALGLGGGLIVIPSLTLFLGVPLKRAIAASIVAVIATSLGGGNVYVRRHVADVRLGILMATATAPSAVLGAQLSTHVSPQVLDAVFAIILSVSAYRMVMAMRAGFQEPELETPVERNDRGLQFRGSYLEPASGERVFYSVTHVRSGVAISTIAGLISGMLGVGGGIVQVPVMNLVMDIPIKVATTTSTYVMGITAMAGAFVYYNHRPSYVDPALAVPVALGVVLGATAGSSLLSRLSQPALRVIFTVVLVIYAVQMVLRVLGIGGAG